ncbi:MAG: protein-tyrosine-phosphatase [Rhodomicrobium sp.]|nr:MAG: protein-tyrosine-phosphatase [Rhodomicrobium sp.]
MNQNAPETAVIIGSPLSQVETALAKYKAGWLVSAINKDTMLETPASLQATRHLKLAMNDISAARDGFVLPSDDHVKRLVQFVDGWDMSQPILVHCWAGVSRSTAGVYISLCHLNPNHDEGEIAAMLRQASPTATPNMRLIALADDYLGREGRMIAAIDKIGRGEMTYEGQVFSVKALLS